MPVRCFGLDHGIGHPIPFGSINQLVAADCGAQEGSPLTPGARQTSTEVSARRTALQQSCRQAA